MHELDPLEIAAGIALEPVRLAADERARRPARSAPGASRRALERAVFHAMQSGRSSVSFSGGRDSSLVLAMATAIARREGLEDPVPITLRHHSAESKEDEWQEVVVRHLGLRDWVKVEVGDRMDVLGPEPTALYRREGLLLPANAYLHLPMVEAAPAGTLLTGSGGDQVLGTPSWRLASVLARRAPPRGRDVLHAGFAAAPQGVRIAVQARREATYSPWLRAGPEREVRRRLAADEVRTRLRWDTQLAVYAGSRSVRLGQQGTQRVGAHLGVRLISPLLDEHFMSTLAGEFGLAGPRSRDHAMGALGSGVLPSATIHRQGKAAFGALAFGPHFRAFVAAWDPSTLDARVRALIDPHVLREQWRRELPVYTSLLLAQKAWLDQHPVDQVDHGGQV